MNGRIALRALCCSLEVLSLLPLFPAMARAQTGSGKWEVELHGGGTQAINSTDGNRTLPAPGASFTTIVGFPSRRVSSWYFGDGTLLLNQVSTALGVGPRITPLDAVLKSSLARRSDVVFGARIARRLTPRIAAELSVDYSRGALELPDSTVTASEATRASFISAWNGVLATGPFFSPAVTSTIASRSREGHQVFTMGSAVINLTKPGKLTPVAIVGGGVVANVGDAPSLTLAGKYQFMFGGVIPVSESDTVTVRYSIPSQAFVGVLGGGFRYALSARSGVRVDVRAHLSKNGIGTLVDATPAVLTSIPGGTASGTNPSLQFASNPPLLNAQSTLSGPSIVGFRTFEGTGIQHQIGVTAGWFWRF